MRTQWAIGFLIVLGAFQSLLQAAWVPPAGFTRTSESFTGDAFAIAPDGKVAIGASSFGGGATIKVYAAAAQAAFADPHLTDPTFPGAISPSPTATRSSSARMATGYRLPGMSVPVHLRPLPEGPQAAGVVKRGSPSAVAPTIPAAGLYSIARGRTAAQSNIGTGS